MACYIFLWFKVDKSELYKPSNLPRRGTFIKALVVSVRIVAFMTCRKFKYYLIKQFFFKVERTLYFKLTVFSNVIVDIIFLLNHIYFISLRHIKRRMVS